MDEEIRFVLDGSGMCPKYIKLTRIHMLSCIFFIVKFLDVL